LLAQSVVFGVVVLKESTIFEHSFDHEFDCSFTMASRTPFCPTIGYNRRLAQLAKVRRAIFQLFFEVRQAGRASAFGNGCYQSTYDPIKICLRHAIGQPTVCDLLIAAIGLNGATQICALKRRSPSRPTASGRPMLTGMTIPGSLQNIAPNKGQMYGPLGLTLHLLRLIRLFLYKFTRK
jgi:hypothetical protein